MTTRCFSAQEGNILYQLGQEVGHDSVVGEIPGKFSWRPTSKGYLQDEASVYRVEGGTPIMVDDSSDITEAAEFDIVNMEPKMKTIRSMKKGMIEMKGIKIERQG